MADSKTTASPDCCIRCHLSADDCYCPEGFLSREMCELWGDAPEGVINNETVRLLQRILFRWGI